MKEASNDFEQYKQQRGEGYSEASAPDLEPTEAGTQAAPHREILLRLLSMVKPVDFRKMAGLEEKPDEKLQKKHYIVVSVEEVLRLARLNNWALCRNGDLLYLYNGAYWSQLTADEVQTFLGEAARSMGIDRIDSCHYEFREKLYKQFLAVAYLPKPEPNRGSVLINLQNGTLEISRDGAKRRDFRAEDFLTYQLPFAYDPDAAAPVFHRYLNEVLPDEEKRRVVAEYLAYIFVKPSFLKLEKALILYGSGANGKSVLFEVVEALLGRENVSNYSLQSLTDDKGYSRAKIVGKLVNYASEINASLEAAVFKALTSGEPVEARLP
ncbi:MAG: DNA primase, partial [Thermoanaerobaculia bacterium]|nr:DNA primase [Thermoanaerobaculia bacterium]